MLNVPEIPRVVFSVIVVGVVVAAAVVVVVVVHVN